MPADRTDKEAVRRALIENRDALREACAAVSDRDWAHAASGWSAAQILEHLVRTERTTLRHLKAAGPSPEADPGRDRQVELARRRGRKFEAPPLVRPQGLPVPRAELWAAFEAARADSLAWLDSEPDLRSHALPHPFFGMLDGYQWLLFFAAHGDRHLLQLRELRARAAPARPTSGGEPR